MLIVLNVIGIFKFSSKIILNVNIINSKLKEIAQYNRFEVEFKYDKIVLIKVNLGDDAIICSIGVKI
ncbi:MAG: hypothetical protein A370_04990 [Clostridium sp. Maddingley MBC34-26]|nr:MAG: hypothetical protein A370_04990 [Clostridium sp. Maddingley MBC34-26]